MPEDPDLATNSALTTTPPTSSSTASVPRVNDVQQSQAHHGNGQSPTLPLSPPQQSQSPANGLMLTNGFKQEQTDDEVKAEATDELEHPDAPPSKRRKVVEADIVASHKSSPRAISPPWKIVEAEGPTSFLEDGKRRSGRTNAVPLELLPQAKKRQTRATVEKGARTHAQKHTKPVYFDKPKPIPKPAPTPEVLRHVKTPSLDISAMRKPSSRPVSKNGPPQPSPTVKKEMIKKETIKKDVSKKKEVKASPKQPVPSTKPNRASTRKPTKPTQSTKDQIRILKKEIKLAKLTQPEESDDASASSSLSEDSSEDSSIAPSPAPLTRAVPSLLKKVSFRVSIPKPTIVHPKNIPDPRKYASFDELLDLDSTDDPSVRPPLTDDQIRREATRRLRVQNASSPGRLVRSALPEKQPEPPRQYAHHDHLLAHLVHFRVLMKKEQKEHRRNAELLAHEAKKYLEAKRVRSIPKTNEQIEREQFLLWVSRYKSVIKDIAKLWQTVEAEVNASRIRQYEQEQQEKLKGHLNRVLDRTDAMLKRHDTDLSDSDLDPTDSDNASTASDSDNSEQISASESDTEASVEADIDPDSTLTAEELRIKYENVPQFEPQLVEQVSAAEDFGSESENSDPDTVMDSELDSDDDNDDDDDDDEDSDGDHAFSSGEEGDESGDDDGIGLMSLFSKEEIENMADPAITDQDEIMIDAVQDPLELIHTDNSHQDSAEATTPAANSPQLGVTGDTAMLHVPTLLTSHAEYRDGSPSHAIHDVVSSRDQSNHNSPGTSATKITEVESVSSVDESSNQPSISPKEQPSKYATPTPPLLRGTLREYQHEGLDWLANLYAGGRSGILADEMGLGKTIQSIALLAHLATAYQVWGPHLIVVPTSVMLNWEMEFKKFLPGFKILTYYGDIKERKQKRRGWMAEDSFNVVITSYQLVLQDAASFKRRKWHYMILDEAHNIKNFRSERWQTMMTFNTRARLLLTGTPLQNNLTELWSLLFFLHYGQDNEGEDDAFAGLREWSEWFKRPVESILEHGQQVLDQEDQAQVAKLHKVIRPFLLRRLKADVEKQMPLKYEHVELCRLSKRQRQLYDGFMSRTQTRETLASGNYLSIINALMQLRKVCNHPDLFETRPISTSFAMPRSVVANFEIQDLLVRRKLAGSDPFQSADLDFLELVPISRERMSKHHLIELARCNAYQPLKDLRERQWQRCQNRSKIFAAADRSDVMCSLESVSRQSRLQSIERTMYYDAYKHHRHPVYGAEILSVCETSLKHKTLSECALHPARARFWERQSIFNSVNLVQSLETRSRTLDPFVEQFACVTPAAMAVDLPVAVIGESRVDLIREQQSLQRYDPFHRARMKLSIAFPDKRLLQYDCGKLQRLDLLLRRLQAGGHRALIFTQMTKVLDILEQFLNIHGHRYLRLDGSTKVEQRQILTDRFNNDNRILCFILSSRSGGIGINLTGADTVIFYDLDWNPAMDRQCTDRAHRIGQTRDVHIYRFVSEHTIESNILRKANQKQLLDDVVIREGDFTTDYLNKVNYRDMLTDGNENEDDVAGAAMDRVLGGGLLQGKTTAAAFEHAEDKDDVAAALVAEKEVENVDDGDFDESLKPSDKVHAVDNATQSATNASDGINNGIQHIDDYLLKLQQYLQKDTPLRIKDRDRSKRGKRGKKGSELRRRR